MEKQMNANNEAEERSLFPRCWWRLQRARAVLESWDKAAVGECAAGRGCQQGPPGVAASAGVLFFAVAHEELLPHLSVLLLSAWEAKRGGFPLAELGLLWRKGLQDGNSSCMARAGGGRAKCGLAAKVLSKHLCLGGVV